MLVRFAFVLLFGIAAHTPAFGQSETAGVGVRTCADYAERMRADPQFTEFVHMTWTQGFMSGLNVSLSITTPRSTVDLLGPAFSVDRQKAFINDFCHRNPLLPYSRAAWELFMAMRTQQQGTARTPSTR